MVVSFSSSTPRLFLLRAQIACFVWFRLVQCINLLLAYISTMDQVFNRVILFQIQMTLRVTENRRIRSSFTLRALQPACSTWLWCIYLPVHFLSLFPLWCRSNSIISFYSFQRALLGQLRHVLGIQFCQLLCVCNFQCGAFTCLAALQHFQISFG